jgi:ethylbenzene dioxygenase beta subunit
MAVLEAVKDAGRLRDREAIHDFLVREANLLDDREFEAWAELFTEDGLYWVPLRPGQESPDTEVSLFCDDRRNMATRFERLRHPRIHSQSPPHRTCHVIGSVLIESVDEKADECVVRSSMIFSDFREKVQRNFAARVRHTLCWDGKGYRIRLKRVDLINCDDVFELFAVPL